MSKLIVPLLFLAATLPACAAEPKPAGSEPKTKPQQLTSQEQAALPKESRAQLPLHTAKKDPEPGQWLHRFQEFPENYEQYTRGVPIRATKERRTIYIQPLGDFTAEQRKILELSREYLQCQYQLPVKMSEDLPLTVIPKEARREGGRGEQILSTYVLNDVLKPRLPKDAAVYLAFTASDLWAGEGWNYVFGQGSKQERVGVWSIARFGDPSASEEEFKQVLQRTLRTSSHETGHMFSLPHCIYFECVMNGSNHLEEADAQPLWLCPQCQAKLRYATGGDVKKQLADLIAFAARNGLKEEEEFWKKSLELVEKVK